MNPLSGLYGAGIALRNTLFDRGVLAAHRLNKPVISVGNLSAGGAGKTPFVIALGELLKERGISFDVLSRGYGRNTRGVRVVESAGSASDFGDEPLLIARKLGVAVVVGESRYEAGRIAESTFQSQWHILDDGFQHRSLARDFDIVLMAAGDFEGRLLPVGRLREPVSSLRRADALVVPEGFIVRRELSAKSIWRMTRRIEIVTSAAKAADPSAFAARLKSCPPVLESCPPVLESLNTVSESCPPVLESLTFVSESSRPVLESCLPVLELRSPAAGSNLPDKSPVVFCGIARPQQFFEMVRAEGITPVAEIAFKDHHAYGEQDIQRLVSIREERGAAGFLTTEKDAINLGRLRAALDSLAIAALRVTIDRPNELVDAILARIAGRKPQS